MIRTTATMMLDAGDRPGGRVVARHDDNDNDNVDDNYSVDDNYPSDNDSVTTTPRPARSRINS